MLGLGTSSDRNGDLIGRLRPFDLRRMNVASLRRILSARVVPAILDLEIGVVEDHDEAGYGYIFIPAQPDETHPTLVAGALVGDKLVGSHVTIPYRAGEDTVFADPARVHSLIAAGRAALRR